MLNLEELIEITLPQPDNFLKVRETLSRIGVPSKRGNTLYQSCHILHKKGRYYIVHFKEMFLLDGKTSDFSPEDRARRNTIANLLSEWGLVDLVVPAKSQEPTVPINQIKIISFKEKGEWSLVVKYTFGSQSKT